MMQVAGIDNLAMLQAVGGNHSLEIAAAESPRVIVAGDEEFGAPPTQLVKELLGVGSLTLVMAAGTLVYKPPHGLLFEHHALAYYLTLAAIFLAGVAEVWTALWLYDGRISPCRRRRRRRALVLGKVVLWVSVVPLAAVTAIGGYTVLVNM